MTYSVIWSPKSKEKLEKFEKDVAARIIRKVSDISENPEPYLIKLTNSDAFRLRVGDYRVVVDLLKDKKELHVITLGHRRNIYKEFGR
ncbi:MAG: type II toxin-antitoxin system RelE/ParE family toxin [Candidatus Diapherotrites archaeon]|nr:type II toxin-antitoxin system RelE/ParE family toxin [Candidatus Diapherotrites archaeon]